MAMRRTARIEAHAPLILGLVGRTSDITLKEIRAELAKAGALSAVGIDPVTESVDQFIKFIANDVVQAAELLKGAGFKPE